MKKKKNDHGVSKQTSSGVRIKHTPFLYRCLCYPNTRRDPNSKNSSWSEPVRATRGNPAWVELRLKLLAAIGNYHAYHYDYFATIVNQYYARYARSTLTRIQLGFNVISRNSSAQNSILKIAPTSRQPMIRSLGDGTANLCQCCIGHPDEM